MSRNNTIDLLASRFIKRRSAMAGAESKKTFVGLDFVDPRSEVAYFDEGNSRILTFECITPWKNWKMDTFRDVKLFEDCLIGLKNKFEEWNLGTISECAMAVPYSFSSLQKSMLVKTAKSVGITVMDMIPSGVAGCLGRTLFADKNKNYLDFICYLRDDCFEFSVVRLGDGIIESLGTIGLTFAETWQSLEASEFQKRISTEIRQFFRDIEWEMDAGGRLNEAVFEDQECRVFLVGQYHRFIEDILFTATGKRPSKNIGSAALGALVQASILRGADLLPDVLKINSFDRNIWIGLGDKGEKEMLLDRYTALPYQKSVSLLLSTETKLRIYEGNFFNPAFDCLLCEIPLDSFDVTEGKELECTLDIGAHHGMSITIKNHRQEILLDRYKFLK